VDIVRNGPSLYRRKHVLDVKTAPRTLQSLGTYEIVELVRRGLSIKNRRELNLGFSILQVRERTHPVEKAIAAGGDLY